MRTCSVRVRFIRKNQVDAVLARSGTLVVQVYRPDCPYCIDEMPHIARASQIFCQKASFWQLNAYDLEEEALDALEIEGLPSVLVYRDGRRLGKHEGYMELEELLEWLDATMRGQSGGTV